MSEAYLSTARVKGNTREDLVIALASIGESDADFCGDNGDEYLWEEARNMGYETNCDYVLDCELKDYNGDELVKRFFTRWIEHDNYYDDYIYDICYDDDGHIRYIALTFTNTL